jgi:hypothetical protein
VYSNSLIYLVATATSTGATSKYCVKNLFFRYILFRTAATSTSCNTPTSTAQYYNSFTATFTAATYTYIASSTGTAVLEFGFSSQGANQFGYLDDVSIVDTNASNAEMLINGGFENTTLAGWQLLCPSNCLANSGVLTLPPCHTGYFCYIGGIAR